VGGHRRGWGGGARGGSPLPRLGTQNPGARRALRLPAVVLRLPIVLSSRLKKVISQEANRALSIVAEEAAPRWPQYAAYCRGRESGMRSVAFQHLSAFVSAICGDSFAKRRDFVDWLCDRFWHYERAAAGLLPEPLLQRVLLPTLEEWRSATPVQSSPWRWSGVVLSATGYQGMRAGLYAPNSDAQEFLTRAIEIDPGDQIALLRLVECRIGFLDFQAHHLPDGYLGDPEADLQLAADATSLCQRIQNNAARDRLLQELAGARELILDWGESQRSGKDFRTWCREHNRNYEQTITRVYVRKPETSA